MGTSSIFEGPVKSLLPDDYDDLLPDDDLEDSMVEPDEKASKPEEQKKEQEQTNRPNIRWKDAKTAMTRYVKGSTSRDRVVNRYVSASGGARQLAQSSSSGRNTVVSLGRILQDFKSKGVEETLHSLQIKYIGKGIKPLLSELVNVISTAANSKEDISARGAANEAVAVMYDLIMGNGGDIESLQRINELTFRKMVEVFISEYIFKKLMSNLQSSFEKYESNPLKVLRKEEELKDYVKVNVEFRVNQIKPETLNYTSKGILNEVNNLFLKCYQAFEGYI